MTVYGNLNLLRTLKNGSESIHETSKKVAPACAFCVSKQHAKYLSIHKTSYLKILQHCQNVKWVIEK